MNWNKYWPDQIFWIWSIEHQAWWASNSQGYTSDITKAGEYSMSQAMAIISDANAYEVLEVAIPIQKNIGLMQPYMNRVPDYSID